MKKEFSKEEMLARRLAGILPVIDIAGHPFTVDWRLKELRPVDDFSTRLDLNRMAMNEDGTAYLCIYHLPSKSELYIQDNITELPKDAVLLEIPYEFELDPVGVARQYGLRDTELLDDHPIIQDLKAIVKPLSEIRIHEIVQRNKAKKLPRIQQSQQKRNRTKYKPGNRF